MSPALKLERRLGLFSASKSSGSGVKMAVKLNRSPCTIDKMIETPQREAHADDIHQKSEDQRSDGT